MSKNYQFIINPRIPSREEIRKHKDFSQLLAQHRQGRALKVRPLRRALYISSAAAAVLLLLFAGLQYLQQPDSPPKAVSAAAHFASQPFVSPPLPDLPKPAFANFRVNTAVGGVYNYPSGSRVTVPAAAFADDYGRLVEGEVDVFFREMFDYVDFFLAGLPMQYDSAGQSYQLESAGMVELYAEQDGRPVKLAEGKAIDVELASEILLPGHELFAPPSFNVYFLDTLGEQWRYQDINQMAFLGDPVVPKGEADAEADKTELLNALKEIEQRKVNRLSSVANSIPKPVKPLRPEPASPERPTLELNFLDGSVAIEDTEGGETEKELQQLQQMYEGVIWQITEDSPAYDPRAFGVEWESVRIRPVNGRDYELALVHPQNSLTLKVSPVLYGEDYQKALNRYSMELQAYEAALNERAAQLEEEITEIETIAAAERQARLSAYEQENKGAMAQLLSRKVVNRFRADKLGVWNCSQPAVNLPRGQRLKLEDQYGQTYDSQTVYLVDRAHNTIYRFYAGGEALSGLQDGTSAVLWLVTPEQKLAVLKTTDPRRINQPKDEALQLRLTGERPKSEAEVRQMLEY
ncbi:hypothetical protein [Phaeodactylibacter luteus]|uniref:Uncharacterized protein n=1 Tax=Phaeodactylibacter luteus TaxID=1564516 RepID=A0A5C6S6T5_9BACT|nr:hypothetical protein [Phaeodactylibacter luteus]TXB70206.1 hypothetical protein FRY97_00435 [Phaeodactylibacter luteus]